MKFKDKILIAVMGCVLVLGTWNIAMSGNITSTGLHQGDLVTFLTNVVTMCNELKSDHNSTFQNTTAIENLVNELKTDVNLIYANQTAIENLVNETKSDTNTMMNNYSALLVEFGSYTSFVTFAAATFTPSAAGNIDSPDAAGTATAITSASVSGSAATTSTTDLTLTGL